MSRRGVRLKSAGMDVRSAIRQVGEFMLSFTLTNISLYWRKEQGQEELMGWSEEGMLE